MIDDLARLLNSTDGQPPSAEFVARLRAEIVAETEGASRGDGWTEARSPETVGSSVLKGSLDWDEDTEVFDLDVLPIEGSRRGVERGPNRRRKRSLALAVASGVILMGGWAVYANFAEKVPTFVDSVDNHEEDETPVETADVDPLAVTAPNTVLEAGAYWIDTLGTPFTLSVGEATGLWANNDGIVSFATLMSDNADDRTITLRRTALLPDPELPTGRVVGTDGWPATDLRGWLNRASDQVTATEPTDTRLGGLDALFVELEFSCGNEDCVAGNFFLDPRLPMFTPGSRYQMWVLDQGQEDPIVVTVSIDDDNERAWFDQAELLLSTIDFKPTEANPVRQVGAGSVELDVFGGVVLEMPEEVVLVEPFEGLARVLPGSVDGRVEFLTRPADVDGIEVTTVDELLRLLADQAIDVAEKAPLTVDGFEARAFEVTAGEFARVVLKSRVEDFDRPESGWRAPRAGHLWIIEHPDRGLLIVSAEGSGPGDAETSGAWTESVIERLDFSEA